MVPSKKVKPEFEHRARLSSGLAVFIGPLAWAADFAVGYGLTERACAAGSSGFLLVSSAIAAAAAMAGLLLALRARQGLSPPARNADATRADPSRFLLLSRIVLSAGFLLAIVAAAIPRVIIDPCA